MAIQNPMGPDRLELNIVGRSARAAAFSAIRAGMEVSAADAFGDEDLRAVSRYKGPVPFPRGLLRALHAMPDAPFIYTGGLDDRPRILARLARARPLWGNGGDATRGARDPFLLAETLEAAGVPAPETRRAPDLPALLAGWLRKPLGARPRPRIRRADDTGAGAAPGAWFWQREVRGPSISAAYAASDRGCAYLGATRQLGGEPWLHAPAFAWCGSIGPLPVDGRTERLLRRAGEAASRTFGLRGLFGIDFVLEDGTPRPVELNPRYPASLEVLEHALGFHAIALQRSAFLAPRDTLPEPGLARAGELLGKAVVFAPADVIAASDLVRIHPPEPGRFPEAADLPARGSRHSRGSPLVTVFARGAGEESVREALRQAASRILRHFRPARGAG
jgi:predicted ATP-grasp superfamily ATP-dependent carboligase